MTDPTTARDRAIAWFEQQCREAHERGIHATQRHCELALRALAGAPTADVAALLRHCDYVEGMKLAENRVATWKIRRLLAGAPTADVAAGRRPRVAGRCPSCRGTSLFLGDGGHVTCSRLDCPNPGAVDDQLHAAPAVEHEGIDVADERAAVSRLWAQDWSSAENAVYDEPEGMDVEAQGEMAEMDHPDRRCSGPCCRASAELHPWEAG